MLLPRSMKKYEQNFCPCEFKVSYPWRRIRVEKREKELCMKCSAELVFQLSQIIKPSSFSLEHMSASLSQFGDNSIPSAPKDFTVWVSVDWINF